MIEFAVEPLGSARRDIESLIPAQWAHTGDSDLPCQPNWDLYSHFAARGALMVVMARKFDEPVGYLAAFLYPHPNAVSVRVASIPTYYVLDRMTRALVMSRMVDYAIERLNEQGIYSISIETSAEFSAGRMWEIKGFKLKKLGYTLELQKPAGVRHA
jgi:GNAT superfamily N-acetyltransferase